MKRTSNDPLHGITLEMILNRLLDCYGWEGLAKRIRINCFLSNPSINSSLKFLRRTPWARAKVEALYRDYLNSNSCDDSWLLEWLIESCPSRDEPRSFLRANGIRTIPVHLRNRRTKTPFFLLFVGTHSIIAEYWVYALYKSKYIRKSWCHS